MKSSSGWATLENKIPLLWHCTFSWTNHHAQLKHPSFATKWCITVPFAGPASLHSRNNGWDIELPYSWVVYNSEGPVTINSKVSLSILRHPTRSPSSRTSHPAHGNYQIGCAAPTCSSKGCRTQRYNSSERKRWTLVKTTSGGQTRGLDRATAERAATLLFKPSMSRLFKEILCWTPMLQRGRELSHSGSRLKPV